MRSLVSALTLLFCLTALSSAQTPSPKASLVAADHAASSSVFQRGVAQGWNEYLADDVVLLYEGAPVVSGRARVNAVLTAQSGLAQLRVQRLPVIVAVSEDGNYGVTSGASILRQAAQSPDSASTFGHYIAVWRRDSGSAPWKVVALLENGIAGEATFTWPAGLDSSPMLISGPSQQLAAADLAFAKMAADSGVHAAFGNFASPDAITPPGDNPVTVGARAIRARMDTPARRQSVWTWHPVLAGISATGDLGFTVGTAIIKSSSAPDAIVYKSKYLTIWQRQADGSYRYIIDSGNERP